MSKHRTRQTRITAPRASDPEVQRVLDDLARQMTEALARIEAASRVPGPAIRVVEDGPNVYLEVRSRGGVRRIGPAQ